jgi:phage I-like protein
MTQKFGYLIDLANVKLTDTPADAGNDNSTSWIMAMPTGEYEHPYHGTIKFDETRLAAFAKSVTDKVRGQDLDIDYDHKEYSGEAAGWVQAAEARPDGLWLNVEWTKKAAELIKSKAYRYFSPEFDDTWTHPKTKQEFKDVLFGGGITNRPFLKDILPINMSEAFANASGQTQEGESSMDEALRKALAKRFGLPEDAAEADVLAKVNEAAEPPKTDEPPKADDKVTEEGTEGEPQPVAASEMEALKKLTESNPALKRLFDVVETQGKHIETQNKKLREAEIEKTVTKLSDAAKAKGYALPPTTVSALKEALEESPSQKFNDKVTQAVSKLIDAGLVELGERGNTRTGEGEAEPIANFTKAVQKMMSENANMSYGDASVRVAGEQPQLFADYQAASYAGRE